MSLHTHALRSAASGTPPTAFRLLRSGANASSKGTFTFGEAEAKAVMAAWQREGSHRLPIDIEHDSHDDAARAARSDASAAVGWFTPALRNGELWATDVSFGPVGLQRLKSGASAYYSPCFLADKQGRVLQIVDCALVSMPALHSIDQLVAASQGLTRTASTTLHARVAKADATAFRALAERMGQPPGVLLRRLITLASSPAADPAEALSEIAGILGIDPATPPRGVIAALQSLVEQLPSGDGASTSPAFEDAPADPAPPAALSKARAAIEARAVRRAERAAKDPLRSTHALRRR